MCSAKYKAPSPLRASGFWLTCVLGVDWCLPWMLQGQARVAAGGTRRLRDAQWAPTAPSTPRGGRRRLRASRARAARGWSAGPSRRALALSLILLMWEPLSLFPFFLARALVVLLENVESVGCAMYAQAGQRLPGAGPRRRLCTVSHTAHGGIPWCVLATPNAGHACPACEEKSAGCTVCPRPGRGRQKMASCPQRVQPCAFTHPVLGWDCS